MSDSPLESWNRLHLQVVVAAVAVVVAVAVAAVVVADEHRYTAELYESAYLQHTAPLS